MPIQTSDNNWSEYKWIVNKTAGLGTHTTIQAAIDAASAGDAIWIYPSTTAYEENLVVDKSLSFHSTDPVDTTILGKITFTGAYTCNFIGFTFKTNGDYCISNTTGAVAYTKNCTIVMADNDAIEMSSGQLWFLNYGSSLTGAFKQFTVTGGTLVYIDGTSVGTTTSASTISAGSVIYRNTTTGNFFISSGTAAVTLVNTSFGPGNQTYTFGGSGTHGVNRCSFNTGTASCLTINNTTTVENSTFTSSNTNAITGSGTLKYDSLSFTSSKTINTSTVTPLYDRLAYTRASNLGIGVDPGTTTGLTFDGTNFLDFYESGDWTPDLKFGGASVGLTYNFRQGRYVRIGDMVWISCVFQLTAVGSSTGNVTIEGLPFAPNASYFFMPVTQNSGITPSAGYVLAFQALNGSTTLSGTTYNNIGGNATMTTTNTTFSNSSYLTFQNCYRTT